VELEPADLEPRHPAFTGFRRVTYLWEDGATSYPIGDRTGIWLDFLAERGAAEAVLAVEGGGYALRVRHAAGDDVWTPGDLEGAPLLRGRTASGATTPARDDLGAAAEALRNAAAAAATASEAAMERDALLRAVAILASDGDGGEVSDVAWPYFLLPERAFATAARRLLAAAAAAWTCTAARGAAAAAVNRGLVADGAS
jgi:hypothetical protein